MQRVITIIKIYQNDHHSHLSTQQPIIYQRKRQSHCQVSNTLDRPTLSYSMHLPKHDFSPQSRNRPYKPRIPLQKFSLPPISQSTPKSMLFNLQIKRSEAINRYFQQKNQSVISNRQHRAKTDPNQLKINSSRSKFNINLSELRMRPLDKYFYRMENIRLAQRLLVVKPSPDMQRTSLKKFFKKQKVYSNQIRRNAAGAIKKKQKQSKIKMEELQKQWID